MSYVCPGGSGRGARWMSADLCALGPGVKSKRVFLCNTPSKYYNSRPQIQLLLMTVCDTATDCTTHLSIAPLHSKVRGTLDVQNLVRSTVLVLKGIRLGVPWRLRFRAQGHCRECSKRRCIFFVHQANTSTATSFSASSQV